VPINQEEEFYEQEDDYEQANGFEGEEGMNQIQEEGEEEYYEEGK